MKCLVEAFGKTRLVRIDEKLSRPSTKEDYVYRSSAEKELLYVSRPEDMYAHIHYRNSGKPFVVVRRSDFMSAS